jgi:hypothetical protein
MRDEIAHLCAEHDRLMCEHDQWMARREAAGAAPVQNSNEPVVLYREHDGNALAPNPEPDAEPSDDDPSFEEAVDKFAAAVERRLFELEKENAELRGKLDALFQLLGTGSAKKLWVP